MIEFIVRANIKHDDIIVEVCEHTRLMLKNEKNARHFLWSFEKWYSNKLNATILAHWKAIVLNFIFQTRAFCFNCSVKWTAIGTYAVHENYYFDEFWCWEHIIAKPKKTKMFRAYQVFNSNAASISFPIDLESHNLAT